MTLPSYMRAEADAAIARLDQMIASGVRTVPDERPDHGDDDDLAPADARELERIAGRAVREALDDDLTEDDAAELEAIATAAVTEALL